MFSASSNKSPLNDLRQNILEIFVKDFPYKKHYKRVKDTDIIRCLDQPLPIDSFFICFGEGSYKIYTTYICNPNVLNVKISYSFFFYFCLCLRNELTKLYFAQDMSLISKGLDIITQLNMSCYHTSSSISINTVSPKLSIFSSISPIYSAFTWVERESAELTGIFFKNLRDSRRLLTDYLQRGYDFSFYRVSGFDSITQDISNKVVTLIILIVLFSFMHVNFFYFFKYRFIAYANCGWRYFNSFIFCRSFSGWAF